jgi:hypothetical protein
MTPSEKKAHYQAVVDALPKTFKARAEYRFADLRVGPATVEVCDYYSGRPVLKLTFGYQLFGLEVKDRSWKQRVRDRKFCYDRVAFHIVSALTQYDALLLRRKQGRSVAEFRSSKLTQAFNKDQLLSRLNIEIESGPVHNTEDGAVRVEFRCKANGTSILRCDGDTFQGELKVFDLSAEQVTAIMAVINLDQLNVLDLITLADDSILGPSIKKLTAELGD